LDRLEARGLAERLRGDGDRRQVRVRLTDRGAETLRHLSALHQEELRHSGPVLVDALQHIIQRVPVPER
jgi:DNA-binding MarR family transcriptional regulator